MSYQCCTMPRFDGFKYLRCDNCNSYVISDVHDRLPVPVLLSVDEAATCLRVSHATVYKLLHAGEIKAYKRGRPWTIPEYSLAAYLENAIEETNQ